MKFLSKEIEEKINSGESLSASELDELLFKVSTQTSEHVLRMIPQVVSYLVKQSSYLKNLTEKFYQDNPDLLDHKDFVSKLTHQIEAENPGKTYEEILSKVSVEAKSRLKTLKTVQ